MNYDLILEALNDYRRWWDEHSEDDTARRDAIDQAIAEIEQLAAGVKS